METVKEEPLSKTEEIKTVSKYWRVGFIASGAVVIAEGIGDYALNHNTYDGGVVALGIGMIAVGQYIKNYSSKKIELYRNTD